VLLTIHCVPPTWPRSTTSSRQKSSIKNQPETLRRFKTAQTLQTKRTVDLSAHDQPEKICLLCRLKFFRHCRIKIFVHRNIRTFADNRLGDDNADTGVVMRSSSPHEHAPAYLWKTKILTFPLAAMFRASEKSPKSSIFTLKSRNFTTCLEVGLHHARLQAHIYQEKQSTKNDKTTILPHPVARKLISGNRTTISNTDPFVLKTFSTSKYSC